MPAHPSPFNHINPLLKNPVKMSGSNENNEPKNASGLTATQSKALEERGAEPHEEKIISAIKEVHLDSHSESLTLSIMAG